MSGREFGIQSSWHDILKRVNPDLDGDELRNATSIAESMNQQIEEFINRFVVTSISDDGSLVFDAAGSYTFEGDVVINGTLDVNGNGTIAGDMDVTGTLDLIGTGAFVTNSSGERLVIDYTTTSSYRGIRFHSGQGDESLGGYVGMRVVGGEGIVRLASAQHTGKNASTITLTPGGGIQLTPAAGNNITATTNVDYIYGTRFKTSEGTASLPGYTFDIDLDTGMYRYTTNEIGFACGGGISMLMDSNDYFHINGRRVYFGINSNDFISHNDTSNYFSFFSDGTERTRLRSGDSLMLGGLHINDSTLADNAGRGLSYTHAEAYDFYRETATGTDGIGLARSNVSGTAVNQHIWYADGSTGNRLNSYGGISDERLKTNMNPYGDPRQDLLDIPVITYQLSGYFDRHGEIHETDDLGPVLLGWGAQTVQQIKPGLVSEDAETGQLLVKSSVFVPMLHRAWQLDHQTLMDIEARLDAAGI